MPVTAPLAPRESRSLKDFLPSVRTQNKYPLALRQADEARTDFAAIVAGRHSGELPHDEFQLAFDGGEVGSRLIGLAQCEWVFVLRPHALAESL